MVKRARKYEAGLVTIFHSVVDVLDPSIKMYGQALLDTPAYKVLMGTDGVNLIETAKYTILSSVSADPVDRADILNTCILPKIA